MEKRGKMVITLLIGVSMIAVLLAALPTGNIEVEPKVNADLTSLVDFDVVSDDTGTAANGVFFVMRTDDSVGMRLVANLTVDETDEHGVDFFIPAELDIVSVLCSFNGDVSSEHVCIREWPMGGHFIYISKARYYPDRTPVGGDGILEVELALNGGIRPEEIDTLSFEVVVSDTVWEEVVISMVRETHPSGAEHRNRLHRLRSQTANGAVSPIPDTTTSGNHPYRTS